MNHPSARNKRPRNRSQRLVSVAMSRGQVESSGLGDALDLSCRSGKRAALDEGKLPLALVLQALEKKPLRALWIGIKRLAPNTLRSGLDLVEIPGSLSNKTNLVAGGRIQRSMCPTRLVDDRHPRATKRLPYGVKCF